MNVTEVTLEFILFMMALVFSLIMLIEPSSTNRNIRNYKGVYDEKASIKDLAKLISMVMVVDSKWSPAEERALSTFLKDKVTADDYESIVRSIRNVKYDEGNLIKHAVNVCGYYKGELSGLYFASEVLYNVAIVDGITADEWLCLCKILHVFFPTSDADFFYFVDKYASFETGPRPYYNRVAKREKSRSKAYSQQSQYSHYESNDFGKKSSKTTQTADNSKKRYYDLLGLDDSASSEDIQKAYRSLAKKYHPDTVQDDVVKSLLAEKFKEIKEAYEHLKKR